MRELPTIPHARVAQAAEGFMATPTENTSEGHRLFEEAIADFSRDSEDWRAFLPHFNSITQNMDSCVFVPTEDALAARLTPLPPCSPCASGRSPGPVISGDSNGETQGRYRGDAFGAHRHRRLVHRFLSD